MSHTASIKSIKIQSVAALRAAVEELNRTGTKMSLVPNAQPRSYYSAHGMEQAGMGKADFVIKLDGAAYDIGLYKQTDGSFEARTDFWMGSVEKVLGATARTPENVEQAKMGKLLQMYGIHAATETARRQGHMVRRINKADGTIALEVTGANL